MTIAEVLKKNGLELGEQLAGDVVKGVFKSLPEILLLTENKFDDLLIPLLGIIEPQIMTLVDKIDGKIGE
jgi:hypothetical protein